jgi:hypothetical protein
MKLPVVNNGQMHETKPFVSQPSSYGNEIALKSST